MEGDDDLNFNIPSCVFGAMALIECCVILCIWGLILRLIETAPTRQTPVSYQLLLSTAEIENQLLLNEFEEKSGKKRRGTVRKTVFSSKVCCHLSCLQFWVLVH
jgi:hypothetical protein